MRPRIVVAIALTAIVYIVTALLWRQVFPFRDGIAEYLPEQAIAYVHVNLTPEVRRALQAQFTGILPTAVDPKKHDRIFLGQVLEVSDVRELALVWYRHEKGPGPFSGTGRIALVIGQRASSRPDVVPAATFTVGGQEVRAFVVRVRSSGRNPPLPLSFPLPSSGGEGEKVMRALRRHPVQAVLRPRALPIPALEAERHLIPDAIAASGTVGRRGFVLRTDDQIPLIVRSTRTELLAEPRPGTFQIIGLPVRALAEQLDLPFHGELRAAIEPLIPEDADLLIDGGHVAVRMSEPVIQPPEAVLRSLAARIWPVARPRQLDGLPASVLVADPDSFEIAQTGPNRWMLGSKSGEARIFAERSGNSVYLATDETLLSSALPTPSRSPSGRGGEGGGAGLRIPSACHLDGQSTLIVWPIHPQAVVTVSVDQSGSNVAICGRILRQGN